MSKDSNINEEFEQILIKAIDSNELVLFVGGGLSKLCGYPLWAELSKQLIWECSENKFITKSVMNLLNNDPMSPMKRISIANAIFKKNGKNISERLVNIFSDDYIKDNQAMLEKKERIISIVKKCNCSIITTNVDTVLHDDRLFPKEAIFDELNSDALFAFENDKCLIHLHGCITKPNDMVFTAEEYANKYKNSNPYIDCLNKLFANKAGNVFVFIGYGLEEFEILRAIAGGNFSKNHYFILNPYLNYEEEKKEYDMEYYKSINFVSIPYSRDVNDYDELIYFLERHLKSVERVALFEPQKIEKAKRYAKKKPDDNIIENALICLKDELFYKYFIMGLDESRYKVDWIKILLVKTNHLHFNSDNILKDSFGDTLLALTKYSNLIIDDENIGIITNILTEFNDCLEGNDLYLKDSLTKSVFISLNISKIILNNKILLAKDISKKVIKNIINSRGGYDSDIALIMQSNMKNKVYTIDDGLLLYDYVKIIVEFCSSDKKYNSGHALNYFVCKQFIDMFKNNLNLYLFLFVKNFAIYVSNNPYSFETIGSFYNVDNNNHSYCSYMLESSTLIKKLVEQCPLELKIQVINDYKNSKAKLLRKMSMYVIGTSFELVDKYCIDNNFILDRYLIADCYIAFRKHAKEISEKPILLNKIKNDISNSKIESPWTPESKIRDYFNDIFSKKEINESLINSDIEDVSKNVISLPVEDKPLIDINKLSFIDKCNKFMEYDKNSNFKERATLRALDEYFYNNWEEVLKNRKNINEHFSSNLIGSLLSPFTFNTREGHEKEIIDLLLNIFNLGVDLSVNSKLKILQSLQENITDNYSYKCDEVLKAYTNECLTYLTKDKEINENKVNFILNKDIGKIVYLLVYIANIKKEGKDEVKNTLEKFLLKKDEVYYLGLAQSVHYLYSLDSKWANGLLPLIFDDDGSSYEILCYSKALSFGNVYKDISQRDTFVSFISDSNEKMEDRRKEAINYYARVMALQYLANNEILDRLFLFEFYQPYLNIAEILLDNYKKANNKEKDFSENRLIDFFKEFSKRNKINLFKKADNYMFRRLIKVNKEIKENNDLWEALVDSSSIGIPYFDKDMANFMIENYASHKDQIIQIYYNIVLKSGFNVTYFNKEEIANVFNYIFPKDPSNKNIRIIYKYLVNENGEYPNILNIKIK